MREDVSFQTSDHVTLRGWFYKPHDAPSPLPTLILVHGFSCLKEMALEDFAEKFCSSLSINCLVYDHRGFGESDTKEGQPRQEILPPQQTSDLSDAITYVQTRDDVNKDKIGLWGTSYGAGHVIWVGAVDRRVKVVISQVPFVDGYANFQRLVRPDFAAGLNEMFQNDRLDRAAGKPPGMMPVVNENPQGPAMLATPDSYGFFNTWSKKSQWKNESTIRTLEVMREYMPAVHISHISPTPLLMVVASNDVITPTDLALEAYSKALEPKELHIVPGGHYEVYSGPNFEKCVGCEIDFLKKHLLS